MSETTITRTDCDCLDQTLTATEPFTAVKFNFGMLLGVDDFETEQEYHHGKMRLHNAWLHRAGVVWGFDVYAELKRNELRVDPGLALDATGHELHLDRMACVDVGAWYEKHQHDEDLKTKAGDGGAVVFDAHVCAIFRTCLDRQVPALAEPCDGSGSETAFSRVVETIELKLVPGLAAETAWEQPYRRLRLLFGLVDARPGNQEDADLLSRRDAIANSPAADQPKELLALFRELAASDVLDMEPPATPQGEQMSILPAVEGTPLILADVQNITLDPKDEGGWTLRAATVDATVRPAHVATQTIQELLCGRLLDGFGAHPADAGGPRVTKAEWDGEKTITVTVDKPLAPKSVEKRAFGVAEFRDASGWKDRRMSKTTLTSPTEVNLTLDASPSGEVIRLIVRGTGLHPLLGVDHVPLAGATGGPPGTASDGHDYVHTLS